MPYSKVNAIAKVGPFMYASTPYSLVEFNIEDNEITRYSKINGLSEIGIVDIESNADQNTLVIAYTSGKDGVLLSGNSIGNLIKKDDRIEVKLFADPNQIFLVNIILEESLDTEAM